MKNRPDVIDLFNLALRHATGRGLPVDLAKARLLYASAAEQGHTPSCVNLGHMYEAGISVDVDLESAERWFRKAATAGDALGQCRLGTLMHKTGRTRRALRWWERAAAAGHTEAKIWLAVAAEEGTECQQDVEFAVETYSLYAQESSLAALRLGNCYADGVGVEKDVKKAEQWYRRAGEAGQAGAWHNLAMAWLESGRHEEAFAMFERAAESGCPEAWVYCGEAYVRGNGCTRDVPRGVGWLKKAADTGLPRAKHVLGWLTLRGEGVEQNKREAFRLCREAAEAGDVDAQFLVAMMHLHGDGTRRDLGAAKQWFRRAAEQGHEEALEKLKQLENLA